MNNETKYKFAGTPGIWDCTETKAGKHKVVDKNGFSIVTTPGYGEESKANTRLIAASPLLLSALIKAVDGIAMEARRNYELDCYTHNLIIGDATPDEYYPDWYAEAKSAIEAALNLKTVQP